jgi:hypothetical protein
MISCRQQSIVNDPESGKRYQAARGKGGFRTENIFPCDSDNLPFPNHVHCLDTTYGALCCLEFREAEHWIYSRQTPLQHHLLKLAIAQWVAQIPANAQQNDLSLEVTPLEWLGLIHDCRSQESSWSTRGIAILSSSIFFATQPPELLPFRHGDLKNFIGTFFKLLSFSSIFCHAHEPRIRL